MPVTSLNLPAAIPRRNVVFPVAFFVLVLLGLSALLIAWRVESVVVDLATARTWRQVKQVRDEMDASFRVGLSVNDMKNLPATLAAKKAEEPDMLGAVVVDDLGNTVAAVNEAAIRSAINPRWADQLFSRGGTPVERSIHTVNGDSLVGLNVVDQSGRIVAVIWTLYSRTQTREVSGAVLKSLFIPISVAALLLLLLGVTLAFRLVRASETRLSQWMQAADKARPETNAKAFIAENDL